MADPNRMGGPAEGAPTRPLTPRENQVCAFAAEGWSNKKIARELGLATSTVATLLGRASRRLGMSSRTELIRRWCDATAAVEPGSAGPDLSLASRI